MHTHFMQRPLSRNSMYVTEWSSIIPLKVWRTIPNHFILKAVAQCISAPWGSWDFQEGFRGIMSDVVESGVWIPQVGLSAMLLDRGLYHKY
jgi:hypothetical protein